MEGRSIPRPCHGRSRPQVDVMDNDEGFLQRNFVGLLGRLRLSITQLLGPNPGGPGGRGLQRYKLDTKDVEFSSHFWILLFKQWYLYIYIHNAFFFKSVLIRCYYPSFGTNVHEDNLSIYNFYISFCLISV